MSKIRNSYVNDEGEIIRIQPCPGGKFEGQPLLILRDDPPQIGGTGIEAPMLLDKGTRQWLYNMLDKLDQEEYQQ